jgi:glycine cleavage system transcriptional repressor
MIERTICLTVLGRERPGIVAAITGVLFDTECNIRDSTMTILAGEFAMLLIVELPEGMTSTVLDQALADVQRRFDLSVFIKRLTEEEIRYQPPTGTKNWAVTIYGGDRRGIVHHVASVMARKGISITELKTKVVGGVSGVGIVSMKVMAPSEVELAAIREQLNEVAARFGVEVSIG